MQAIQPKESRSAEYAQTSATQGNGGSDGGIFATLKRGGKEVAQESAKTDGLCK